MTLEHPGYDGAAKLRIFLGEAQTRWSITMRDAVPRSRAVSFRPAASSGRTPSTGQVAISTPTRPVARGRTGAAWWRTGRGSAPSRRAARPRHAGRAGRHGQENDAGDSAVDHVHEGVGLLLRFAPALDRDGQQAGPKRDRPAAEPDDRRGPEKEDLLRGCISGGRAPAIPGPAVSPCARAPGRTQMRSREAPPARSPAAGRPAPPPAPSPAPPRCPAGPSTRRPAARTCGARPAIGTG
jgi:hypothetical protein